MKAQHPFMNSTSSSRGGVRQAKIATVAPLLLGAISIGCASMTAHMTGLTVEEVELHERYRAGEWVKAGGETDPLGRVALTIFRRRGLAVEAIRRPYQNATAALVVSCNEVPPTILVVMSNAPSLRGAQARGEARVQGWSGLHPIAWVGMGGEAITSLAGKVNEPTTSEFPDLREALHTGDSLTVSAPTTAGTVYFSFDLEGLEIHEKKCPPAPDTAASSRGGQHTRGGGGERGRSRANRLVDQMIAEGSDPPPPTSGRPPSEGCPGSR